jgi:glycolate oxidase FAD binding subunit
MSAIAAQLSDALSPGGLLRWSAVSSAQQSLILGAIADSKPPACLALPSTLAELSQIMALATRHGWRMLPMGQGSKLSWGGLAERIDIVVSTAKLNRVIEHAVGDFTVTVEPGIKIADLQQQLAERGQFLAIDPAFAGRATVGGMVATADVGSLRARYGGLRDMLIGVQFARYDGQIAKAGGRVVKNVAGYDLMKLMTGAYGSLGILSELTFRLYPAQANSRTLLLTGSAAAVEPALAEIRRSGLTPVALDVLSARLLASLSQQPDQQLHLLGLLARFQAVADAVQEQTERLQTVATAYGLQLQQLDSTADAEIWQQLAAVLQPETILCKVGMQPSAIVALLTLLETVMPESEAKLQGTSGLGWVQWRFAADGFDVADVAAKIEKLRSHCQQNGGFLTLLQAPKSLKQAIDVWGYSGNALGVMADIKAKFDPQRQLSPGRFVGGL